MLTENRRPYFEKLVLTFRIKVGSWLIKDSQRTFVLRKSSRENNLLLLSTTEAAALLDVLRCGDKEVIKL